MVRGPVWLAFGSGLESDDVAVPLSLMPVAAIQHILDSCYQIGDASQFCSYTNQNRAPEMLFMRHASAFRISEARVGSY